MTQHKCDLCGLIHSAEELRPLRVILDYTGGPKNWHRKQVCRACADKAGGAVNKLFGDTEK